MQDAIVTEHRVLIIYVGERIIIKNLEKAPMQLRYLQEVVLFLYILLVKQAFLFVLVALSSAH